MGHHDDPGIPLEELPGSSTERDELIRLLGTLRAEARTPVEPDTELIRLFQDGLAMESPRPALAARTRGSRMLETLVAKLGGLGMATKMGIGSVAVAGALTGAGAAGVLPGPVQAVVDRIVADEDEAESRESEGGSESLQTEADSHRGTAGGREGEHVDRGRTDGGGDGPGARSEHGVPDARAEFGRWVAEQAEDGGVDGQQVADAARPRPNHGRETAEQASAVRSGGAPPSAGHGPSDAGSRPDGGTGDRATPGTERAPVDAPARTGAGQITRDPPVSPGTGAENHRGGPRGAETGAEQATDATESGPSPRGAPDERGAPEHDAG
jgi:hypothetical protein